MPGLSVGRRRRRAGGTGPAGRLQGFVLAPARARRVGVPGGGAGAWGWAGGPSLWLLLLPCLVGAAGEECGRRSAPAARWVYRPGCLPSLARAAGHAGRVSVEAQSCAVHSMTRRRPTYFFGFVSSPCGERPRKTRWQCVPPLLRARVTVRWSTRSPGVGLCWLFAIWSGTPPWNPPLRFAPARWYIADSADPGGDPPEPPACAPRPRGGTSPTVLTRGANPPEPPACAPRPRGGTSPTHRPLTGPKGPVRWAGNDRLAVTRCGSRRQHRALARACGPDSLGR